MAAPPSRLLPGAAAGRAADTRRRYSFVDIGPGEDLWDYSVLATCLVADLASFGPLYRDRGEAETIFDELQNQWGWGGFVIHDLARCRLAARRLALVYDWWNIFVPPAEPELPLHAIAERVRHARATTIKIASPHARAVPPATALHAVALLLRALVENAELLTNLQRWRQILARAFQVFHNGRSLRLRARLAPC